MTTGLLGRNEGQFQCLAFNLHKNLYNRRFLSILMDKKGKKEVDEMLKKPEDGLRQDPPVSGSLDKLLSELAHYRSQTERLQRVNELHDRLAGIVDLSTMVEAYSVWLAQYVPHKLIGYSNSSRQRMQLFCSGHGPERKQAVSLAQRLLKETRKEMSGGRQEEGFYVYSWQFESVENCGLLVLLRNRDRIPDNEIGLVNDSLAILAEPLRRALEYEELFEQARKDALTGLANRRVYRERIDSLIEGARRHGRPLTLALLDLDHFKAVNDTMGHQVGDKVLQKVAKILSAEIRSSDLLVRMGGDEFLLVLTDTDKDEGVHLVNRLCNAVAALKVRAGDTTLGISVGLVQWRPGLTRSKWLEEADDLLYQAKSAGRSQAVSQ